MEKILLAVMLMFAPLAGIADPVQKIQDDDCFWPPDMVPHPMPPGDGPSGPGEPEMV